MPKPKNVTSNKLGFNTHYYRMCFNSQIFEMLCTLDSISATTTVKEFSGTQYRISSVDGETHKVGLLVCKLWDLILLKLCEIVYFDREHSERDYRSRRRYTGRNKENPLKWYNERREYDDDEDFDDDRKDWWVFLSVKTVAQCLGISPRVDALTHLYDRIVAASKVLRNIDIEISTRQNGEVVKTRIDGYVDSVGVRDCSYTEERYLTKSNALFAFRINPRLIDYVAEQKMGFYHFNHSWLGLPEHCQNAYAAVKRLARHFSQNTFKRNATSDYAAVMKIGALRRFLPSLNNKRDGENRVALDKSLKSISCARYAYIRGEQQITFEELMKLRLRRAKYDEVKVAMAFSDHPNTSDNTVTTERIENMNEDAAYIGHPAYSLELADTIIDHKGMVKKPVKRHNSDSDKGGDTIGDEDGEMPEYEIQPRRNDTVSTTE